MAPLEYFSEIQYYAIGTGEQFIIFPNYVQNPDCKLPVTYTTTTISGGILPMFITKFGQKQMRVLNNDSRK